MIVHAIMLTDSYTPATVERIYKSKDRAESILKDFLLHKSREPDIDLNYDDWCKWDESRVHDLVPSFDYEIREFEVIE